MAPKAEKKNKLVSAPSSIAVIYARYSSHAQKDVSIEQQVLECREYAEANNMAVVEVYADRALTGKSDKRPEFQKMIRHAEKRQFHVVISYKSNRMARNMLQALAYEDRLSQYGIRVVYVKEEFGDNAAGRFALRTMMNVNQFYSENMAEDIKRGLYDNAANCMITNGGLPLGYKKGPDGKYALDPPNDAVVREIFSRVACKEAYIDIANDLNARGIKTSRGGAWNKNSFRILLRNERYTGVYIYGDVRIEGGVPQIIGKELFAKVQKIIENPSSGPKGRHSENGDYLLTGKLYCGKCSGHMVGISGTSKTGKIHYYYACQKKRLEKTCDKDQVRRDWLEQEVAAAVKRHIIQDDVIAWIADSTVAYGKKRKEKSEISLLEDQLAEAKKATKNLLAAIEQGIVTPTTKERLMELESEQSRITNLIAIERSQLLETKREDIIAWLESLRNGDVADKTYQAKLFDTFLSAVYLYDDHLKIIFGFSGKKNAIGIPFDLSLASIEEEGSAHCSYKLPLEPPY